MVQGHHSCIADKKTIRDTGEYDLFDRWHTLLYDILCARLVLFQVRWDEHQHPEWWGEGGHQPTRALQHYGGWQCWRHVWQSMQKKQQGKLLHYISKMLTHSYIQGSSGFSKIHCIPKIILQWCAGYSELCDSKSRRLLNIMGGSSELNTDNRHLCADHRFWSQVSCHNYGARWVPALGKSLKELRSTGMRCNGTIQVHFYTLIKIIEILM